MKNCIRCGTGNEDKAAFCSLCGEPFEYDFDAAPADYAQAWDNTGYYEGAGYQHGQTQTPQYEVQRERRVRAILVRIGAVLLVVLLVMMTVFAVRFFRRIPDPVPSPDMPVEINIMSEPVQTGAENAGPFHNGLNNSTAAPCAGYAISAKVLDVLINTGYGKEGAMPIDLALIWGNAAETDYDKYLKYRFDKVWKHNQWLEFQLDTDAMPPGIGAGDLMTHISNNHIFPANENIFNAVAHLKKGEEVMLSGYLVDVTDSEGHKYHTSLRRDDTDAGACECFYVDRVQTDGKVYE